MTLNASGQISLAGSTTGQSIALELGLGATTQISLNDSAVRTLAGVPSGAIIIPTNFYGKSNLVTINLTIASNTKNYNIKSSATGYSAGKTTVNLTINSGVVVGSTSTSTYAMDTGSGWATGDVINITNNGYIAGKGGTGGHGGIPAHQTGYVGTASGAAINLQWSITTFTNSSGYVYSGGGGGGGGACGTQSGGGGGGGGGGSSVGIGGAGNGQSTPNRGAVNGTNHGHGGKGGGHQTYYGGAGGALGSNGGAPADDSSRGGGGGGGGGGGASGHKGGVGNSFGSAGGGHGKAINLNGKTINGTTSLTRTYGGIS